MQGNLGVAALLIGVVALGVSGYALLQDTGDEGLTGRIALLEQQVDDLQVALAEQEAAKAPVPSLMGHSLEGLQPSGDPPSSKESGGAESPARADGSAVDVVPLAADGPAMGEDIEALVDKAVEKKAAQMQTMRNKKPSIDVFAKTLELDDEQRAAVERDVVRAQNALRDLLRTPTADGTDLMEELIEVMAQGIADPGENPGAGAKWFQRVMSEKVPGYDETYAVRAETLKNALRQSFKRTWSEAQYARFEEWKMDPTEVQGIENSPWKEVEQLVRDRARALGAELPEDG